MEARAEDCVPNIGPEGRRMRQRFGAVALGLGFVLGLGLAFLGVNPLWRLAAFVPLSMGAFGVFQARAKT